MAGKLLIVDDNAKIRKSLTLFLKMHGYDVSAATDGEDAMQKARRGPPDAVISDILMPNMDGYALCYEWKNDACRRDFLHN